MELSRISGCPFCDEFDEENVSASKTILSEQIGIESRVIYRDNDFVVFPTVGCFVPGYILLATLKHYPCFGALTDDEFSSAQEMIRLLRQKIRKIYNSECVIFEHGIVSCGDKYGGCIDHAHIHFVPLSESVISHVKSYGMTVYQIDSLARIRNCYENNEPYLFLSDVDGTNYEIHNVVIPSQFLRQVVCKVLGIDRYWNWHTYSFTENITLTLKQFQQNNELL